MVSLSQRLRKDDGFFRAIVLGILSSLFFSVTFVVNKSLSNAGDSWQWSSSLRYMKYTACIHGTTLA